MSQVSQLLSSFGRLSRGRALAMLLLAAALGGMIFISFAMLNKPVREVLYSNLDAEDVNRIGSVLSEVGISFDVNEAGTAVLVEHGKTAQARMILASKGLPKSDKAGYELFDQMGSLGLTSFMQQVTRVRALEGELVRTIQQLEGVKAARVHLALKSEGTFRNRDEKPSASVVIRTGGTPTEATAAAIRQIVASAIPGLTVDQVVVSTTDGQLLSTPGGQEDAVPTHMLDLEQKVARETQERIERTIAPIAGLNNVRVSVAAKLDMDKRQTTETNYDPESKVERSTRSVKSSDQSSGGSGDRPVSADQNIPQEVGAGGSGDTTSKKKENKEELVNYEVGSRQTETVSNGYRIDKLAVAVVVNRKAFLPTDGTAPDEAKLKERLVEIEELVKSASGIDEARKDTVRVVMMDFVEEPAGTEEVSGPGVMDQLMGNLGTIINAGALLTAIVLVIMLGLRPTMKMLLEAQPREAEGGSAMGSLPSLDNPAIALPDNFDMGGGGGMDTSDPAAAVPIDKLNRIVGIDMDRAAQVLKQWLERPVKEAA
ncbi:MAG: flagellar M-ring protein FliF [Rhizobiales bacterium]|nr:flagellar M-ring protein FliF [Hyphomicrobiales bacterium]